jgi:hypothetical protein
VSGEAPAEQQLTAPPEAPAPPPALASTGVPSADAAAQQLHAVDDAALEDHVEIYEDVHRRLQEGLADLDEQ